MKLFSADTEHLRVLPIVPVQRNLRNYNTCQCSRKPEPLSTGLEMSMQVRRRVRSSSLKGVDAGIMCGFGVGYGFGAGLVIKPSALHALKVEAQTLTGDLSFITTQASSCIDWNLKIKFCPTSCTCQK